MKKHEPKNGDPRKGEPIKKFQFAGNETIDSGFDEKLAVNIGIMATKLATEWPLASIILALRTVRA